MLYFFRRLRLRVIWSTHGIVNAWREEHSFRSWVWANLVSAALAIMLPLSPGERALILALGLLVLPWVLSSSAVDHELRVGLHNGVENAQLIGA